MPGKFNTWKLNTRKLNTENSTQSKEQKTQHKKTQQKKLNTFQHIQLILVNTSIGFNFQIKKPWNKAIGKV